MALSNHLRWGRRPVRDMTRSESQSIAEVVESKTPPATRWPMGDHQQVAIRRDAVAAVQWDRRRPADVVDAVWLGLVDMRFALLGLEFGFDGPADGPPMPAAGNDGKRRAERLSGSPQLSADEGERRCVFPFKSGSGYVLPTSCQILSACVRPTPCLRYQGVSLQHTLFVDYDVAPDR